MNLYELQCRVSNWVNRTFGIKTLCDREERGLRHVEESIELAQCLGVPRERLLKLVNVVYDKPVGDMEQEIAGSMTTLLAVGSAVGVDVYAATTREIYRLESLPPEHFQKRNAAKAAAGVGNYGTKRAMNRTEKQKAVDEFMSKPQPKDDLGYLEPDCPVLRGYSWTPETGLVKDSKEDSQ